MGEAELVETVHEWDEAIISNDAGAIGSFIADEWTIVGPDGSISGKDRFLSLIAGGDLKHDAMASEDLIVRLYGSSAVVIAKGVSGGTFKGQPFRELERSSNVFIRRNGRWVCVSTHLSKLTAASPSLTALPAS
jgi:ketosteroid isomerase-like protein